MVTEMLANLINKSDLIDGLIRLNGDAVKGFDSTADACSDEALAAKLRNASLQRGKFRDELVALRGGDAPSESSGTIFGEIHRSWIDARAKLNGGDPSVIVPEIKRAEMLLIKAYDAAIEKTDEHADVLKRQRDAVELSMNEMAVLDS